MAKEQFFYPETQPLFKALEMLRQRSGISRGQAFEDWLTAIVCALAAETKEEEYLAMVERHKNGKAPKRGIDLIAEMFGQLVHAMEQRDADILGDLFQGAITYGENGLYLTPDAITQLMAQMTIAPNPSEDGRTQLINDCCCGTGRMLLEASKINSDAELVGQDVDSRCARITAINLALRGKYGWVVCGNTLSGETQFAYRIGHFYHETPQGLRRGVIRDVPPAHAPIPVVAKCTSSATEDLFRECEAPAQSVPSTSPSIIEVPRWLARLEPQLAALERGSAAAIEEPPKQPELLPEGDPPSRTQQNLF